MACLFMLIDHVGVRLFPHVTIMRIIGRLAFPIFAFFIAEGCRHTSNRLKHFLSVFILGAICESAYIIYSGGWYGNILLTFSVSILLIYLMQWCRKKGGAAPWFLFAAVLATLCFVEHYVNFDYGISGIFAPLFAALPGDRRAESGSFRIAPPKKITKLLLFAFGIMLTIFESTMPHVQVYALLTVPLLAMYSEGPGKRKLKYFFYIFYPVHLLLIEAAAMIL